MSLNTLYEFMSLSKLREGLVARLSASAGFLGSHGAPECAHGLLVASLENGNAPGLDTATGCEVAQ